MIRRTNGNDVWYVYANLSGTGRRWRYWAGECIGRSNLSARPRLVRIIPRDIRRRMGEPAKIVLVRPNDMFREQAEAARVADEREALRVLGT